MKSSVVKDKLWKWHYRYGHLNSASPKKFCIEKKVGGLKSIKTFTMRQKTFVKSVQKSNGM